MKILSQPQTIESGLRRVGRPLGSVPANKLPSRLPEMLGKLFGRLKVISPEVFRGGKGNKAQLKVRCLSCSKESYKDRSSLLSGTAGCRECGNPRSAPKWLVNRAISAKQRCTNPNDQAYQRYGARGIRFLFGSPTEMAVWVQTHLGLFRHLELDRIDNNGHYETGNLRYSTAFQNKAHTRRSNNISKVHWMRLNRPEIRYADSTLAHLFSRGFSVEEIIARYQKPSTKPKGVYGTYLTPDPFIVSQWKDS